MTRLLLCVLALSAASACNSDAQEPMRQGRLALRSGESVGGMAECGVDLPSCPTHLSCVAFTLDGVSQARCVDPEVICTEVLSCTGGTSCAILESYPSRVVCSGTCKGDDCDGSVSNSGP
ncbi:hypothetical protein POL68_23790 [Stigmatella sp. ncwal1]|uniref:Lipoprotein n=1 Tax=Stigmatella ashevillensis TaxID=2995309 RepID=A0ABT5DD31_9BACT|nr:hypothetical protein [Stigmatella ashevillena]MDC0711514.1 hypothetical protein [Stigmatella ashevillena]